MKTRCNINIELNTGYYMQLPKLLFSDKFKSLNSDTKLIYALLRDRHQISAYKKMSNSKGEIFVIFPREKIAEILNLSLPTVRKSIKNLIEIGLIEEERQGLNKPNLIYLLQIQEFENSDFNTNKDMCFETSVENIELELDPSPTPILVDETISETNILSEEKIINFQEIQDISDSKNLSLQEVKNKYFYSKRENNLLSGEKNSFSQEEKNVSGSIINKSLINISLNNLSNQYIDRIDKVKTQIDYSVLKSKENNKKYLDLIVDIMADINCSTEDIVIGKILRPVEIAKNRISSLNQFHIEYVIECLEESNIEIQNIKQYILTALFNAPSSMEFYYDNKIKTMLG